MSLKILMCRCEIEIPIHKRLNHFEQTRFYGCDCQDDYQYFVATCSNCPYNTNSFSRNYFTSTNCYPFREEKNYLCEFCFYLNNSINYNFFKVCVAKNKRGELDFERLFTLIDYLHEKANPSLFFVFDKEKLCQCIY